MSAEQPTKSPEQLNREIIDAATPMEQHITMQNSSSKWRNKGLSTHLPDITKSPEQEAEEIASKVASKVIDLSMDELVDYIKTELNLASLLTDRSELLKLSAELKLEREANYHVAYGKAMEELAQLRAENVELRKDKERLDWLDKNPASWYMHFTGIPIRQALTQAMKGQ